MSEWSNVPVSKIGKVQAFGGSNPPLCAKLNKNQLILILFIKNTTYVVFFC